MSSIISNNFNRNEKLSVLYYLRLIMMKYNYEKSAMEERTIFIFQLFKSFGITPSDLQDFSGRTHPMAIMTNLQLLNALQKELLAFLIYEMITIKQETDDWEIEEIMDFVSQFVSKTVFSETIKKHKQLKQTFG